MLSIKRAAADGNGGKHQTPNPGRNYRLASPLPHYKLRSSPSIPSDAADPHTASSTSSFHNALPRIP